NSLINEAELLAIYHQAFHDLKVPEIKVKMNSRKVLAGLAEVLGQANQLTNITVAIDKLDKIGWDGVAKELAERGLDESSITFIEKYLHIEGNNDERIKAMAELLGNNSMAQAGLEELRQ